MIRVGLGPSCPWCGLRPRLPAQPKDGPAVVCARCGGTYVCRELYMGITASSPDGPTVPCRSCGDDMPRDRVSDRDAPGLCWPCAHGSGPAGSPVLAKPTPPPTRGMRLHSCPAVSVEDDGQDDGQQHKTGQGGPHSGPAL